MAVYILGKWELGWFSPRVEIEQWRHTCVAYGVDALALVPKTWTYCGDLTLLEFANIDEALANCLTDYKKVFVELPNSGDSHIPLREYTHPEKALYIFGNSASGNASYITATDDVIGIETPIAMELWAVTALGIILYDRELKKWQLQ